MHIVRRLAFLLLALAAGMGHADAPSESDDWVAAWTASPQPLWTGASPPPRVPARLSDQTVRQVARLSLGGSRVRVVLSNQYGKTPLVIGAAQLGLNARGASLVPGSGRALKFGGRAAVSVPAGASVRSDPVDLAPAPLSRIAVSLYFPQPTTPATFHWEALQTAFVVKGNRVAAERLLTRHTLRARVFLSRIEVENPAARGAVVAFGDSITDGSATTPDRDRRWTDGLAERLAPRGVAVLNAGIAGARLLGDGMGSRTADRFARDALEPPGVKSVVVLLGINDIGWPGTSLAPHEAPVTAEALIAGYRELIIQARRQRVRIVGGTLLPFEGALSGTPQRGYYSARKEAVRQAVNRWIRTSGEFDAVVDFDALLRDPQHPTRLKREYDCGDHLHPNDRGHAALARGLEPALLLP